MVELTSDHKPDNEQERERIQNANGFVQFNRVCGDLSLSRAIGDTRYKQSKDLLQHEQQVICIPDITYTIANPSDYLMLYCDGIVEYKTNEDVADFFWQHKLTNDTHGNSLWCRSNMWPTLFSLLSTLPWVGYFKRASQLIPWLNFIHLFDC